MSDPTELGSTEFHPAARSAYRWLKGFMVTNTEEYTRTKFALRMAAESGNRQAEVCMGTIDRLAAGQPVSDRYLLGLAWTILQVHNYEAMEGTAQQRIDQAYGPDDTEWSPENIEH